MSTKRKSTPNKFNVKNLNLMVKKELMCSSNETTVLHGTTSSKSSRQRESKSEKNKYRNESHLGEQQIHKNNFQNSILTNMNFIKNSTDVAVYENRNQMENASGTQNSSIIEHKHAKKHYAFHNIDSDVSDPESGASENGAQIIPKDSMAKTKKLNQLGTTVKWEHHNSCVNEIVENANENVFIQHNSVDKAFPRKIANLQFIPPEYIVPTLCS
ncbi:uncharacterized protein LOC119675322 [Teleopsis dalmanni]|uniref:uncharacterized protein LOC119675322 n=1 Tax=Teleopsis dalmanni TaxID=139649 RepID=UPI0018CCBD5F|nr:uncharacterized protein LOC119675322 [Teleopsis dalmanni]